jgi:ATP-dependent Clp protease ATP-binding subunit ClpA
VSKDDAEVLSNLQETLKRVVYGQDRAIDGAHLRRSSSRAPA